MTAPSWAAAPLPPRVLLHAFSTFKLGGPQARFVQLANAFGTGFRHLVVAMDGQYEAGARLGPEVDWQAVPIQNRRGSGLANRAALRRLLKDLQPDLLLTYNWGAIEWAAANLPQVVPHVHVEDGFGPEEAQGQFPRRVWMRRLLVGLPGRRLLVPSATLQRIALEVWRFPPQQLLYVPNGVAVPPFQKPWDDPSRRPLRVGTLAALRAEKNLPRLIRAFAALRATREAQLIILGDGPQRPDLQALAQQLGVAADVDFRGHQDNPQGALLDIDLFALSSDTEQLPLSLLEALAVGLPAIGTRVGDVGSLLDRVEPGWTCAPTDADFRALLLRACQQPARWLHWGQQGQHFVAREYSQERMLTQWRRLFDGEVVGL